ncbi:MAG: Flp family type IVb pilin [Planctomycetota bacterium]|jgi:Flp pilus assembly pilin Flp
MLRTLKNQLLALHRDEQGADMVEYILIVAAIALPLLGVIVFFWDDIKDWIFEKTEEIKYDVEEAEQTG